MSKSARKTRRNHDTHLTLVPDRPVSLPAPPLRPKTPAQGRLLSSLKHNALSLVSGSAGVGKTYVTLAHAADLLRNNEVERLILTRPLVGTEAEERVIGALPNDLNAKLAPWVMPMMDVLEERLGVSFCQYLLKTDRIRVSPLAYMRGSSFKNAFVFMTEAQNTTVGQMKMFLTRIGEGSRVCVEGDLRQSDLERHNGLADAIGRLSEVRRVGVVEFERADCVRSDICAQVLAAYDED